MESDPKQEGASTSEDASDQELLSQEDQERISKFKLKIPYGHRFVPTDDELIRILNQQINNKLKPNVPIFSADVYKHSPQELTKAFPTFGNDEWYFFTSRKRKGVKQAFPSAGNGYWKVTAEKPIHHNGERIGSKIYLLFYEEEHPMHPKGKHTKWAMEEYVVDQPSTQEDDTDDKLLDESVVCRICVKAYWTPKKKKRTAAWTKSRKGKKQKTHKSSENEAATQHSWTTKSSSATAKNYVLERN